ncbi:MAG: MFS transporter [Negativicutes bacterium]
MRKQKTLIILSFSVFLLMLGDGMVMALLPNRVVSLTHSGVFVGYLASAYALAQMAMQLTVGMFADRWGFGPFLLLGYVLSFVAGMVFYCTNDLQWILCGRILQGIGEAPLMSLGPALLSNLHMKNKGHVIGVYNAAIFLGVTAGPAFRVMSFPDWSDHQIFLLYAFLCLPGMVFLYLQRDTLCVCSEPTVSGGVKDAIFLLKDRYFFLVFWGIAIYGAGLGIFMTTLPAFMLMERGYEPNYVQWYFSLFYVAISVAQMTVGRLSDRWGRRWFMIGGMLLAALGLGLAVGGERIGLASMLGLSSFGLGTYCLASMAFLNDLVPAQCKGLVSGIYYLFWGLGMFWGPLLLTEYIRNAGYPSGFYAFALILGSQALLLMIIRRRMSDEACSSIV